MLEPPESLEEVHTAYLSELQSVLSEGDGLVSSVAGATSLAEVQAIFEGAASFDAACLPLAEAAAGLGIDAQLPCG